MYPELSKIINGKKVLILGMGQEGQSTLRVLTKWCKPLELVLADSNENLAENFGAEYTCQMGSNYLDHINDFDLIIKSPGIPRTLLLDRVDIKKVRSQTDIFLELYSQQVIGITGTKGKSTSASLLFSILNKTSKHVLLVGNIGLPPFDFLEDINRETIIVFELSSHQLDGVNHSPHIAIILNLFEEHLDHYGKLNKYYQAKLQIARYHSQNDYLIYNGDDTILEDMIKSASFASQKIKFARNKISGTEVYLSGLGKISLNLKGHEYFVNINNRKSLPGIHNEVNAMAVTAACFLCDVSENIIAEGINEFAGLPHRLQFVGEFRKIRFYDDSISTIPQATIEAVKTLKEVDTLILGGKDRGINYKPLVEFIPQSSLGNIFCMGGAGKRIYELLQDVVKPNQKLILVNEFAQLSDLIRHYTKVGKICLLSPAAPSYDWFANFAERGEAFKKIARNL